jgi:hypothetical protein
MDLWIWWWPGAPWTHGLAHGGSSSERSPHGAPGSQGSPRWRERGEEPTGVLTRASVGSEAAWCGWAVMKNAGGGLVLWVRGFGACRDGENGTNVKHRQNAR